jgi:hypothetical protein
MVGFRLRAWLEGQHPRYEGRSCVDHEGHGGALGCFLLPTYVRRWACRGVRMIRRSKYFKGRYFPYDEDFLYRQKGVYDLSMILVCLWLRLELALWMVCSEDVGEAVQHGNSL